MVDKVDETRASLSWLGVVSRPVEANEMTWKTFFVLSGLGAVLSVSCGGKDGDAVDSGVGDVGPGDADADQAVDSGDSGGDDADDPDPCEVGAALVSPTGDGVNDFYYRDSVIFALTLADGTAAISLAEAAGGAVAGQSVFDANTDQVVFTPDAPLTPETAYEATLSLCAGEEISTVSFSTSSIGSSLEAEPSSLIGRSYLIALAEAEFVQPAGVGVLLSSMIDQNILLGIVDANDTSLEVMGAVSESGGTQQDFCNPSLAFPTADFSASPYFQIGPQDTTLAVSGYSVTIAQLKISGDFAADGSRFGGGQLSGQVDVRDLMGIGALAGLAEDAEALCALVESISAGAASCQPCVDGEVYCLDVEVIDADGEENPDQVLESLDECDPERCVGGCR